MGDKESINPVDGQKYKSLPTDPPPSYNEVIHNQPSAPSLNAAGAISSGDDIMPKPSAPTLEPDLYKNGFANAGQQLMVTNAPYSTTTYEIPANNVIIDEGTPYVGRRRHLDEDDDGCCCCDDDCEGCLACMTVFNCIVQSCSLILQIASACSKN